MHLWYMGRYFKPEGLQPAVNESWLINSSQKAAVQTALQLLLGEKHLKNCKMAEFGMQRNHKWTQTHAVAVTEPEFYTIDVLLKKQWNPPLAPLDPRYQKHDSISRLVRCPICLRGPSLKTFAQETASNNDPSYKPKIYNLLLSMHQQQTRVTSMVLMTVCLLKRW